MKILLLSCDEFLWSILYMFACFCLFHITQSLNSKKRTAEKNGGELQGADKEEFDRVTSSTNEMQRTIEKLRKQLKSHTNITNDYRVKRQKALGSMTASPAGSTTPTGQEQPQALPVSGTPQSQPGQTVIGQTSTPTAGNQIANPNIQTTMPAQAFQQGMVVNRMPGQQQTIPIQMQQQNQGGVIQQPQQRMQMMPGQQPGMPQRMMISPQQQQQQIQGNALPPLQIPAHQLNQINQMPPQQRHAFLQKLQHEHQMRIQQQQQQQQHINPQQMAVIQQQRMRAQQMGQPIGTGSLQQQQQPQQQQMMLTRMQGNPGGPIQQLQQQVRMPIQPQGHPMQIQGQMQGVAGQIPQHQMAVSSAGMTIQRQQGTMQMAQGQMMQQRPLVQMQGTISQIQGPVPNSPQHQVQQGVQSMTQGQQQPTQASFSHGQQIAMSQQQPQTSPHPSNPASLGSPHSMQPSPHSSQPSPQSFPAASPGPTGAVRPQGISSPMNMPPSSPSMSSPGPNVPGSAQSGMSPMNAPSQSPQPSMSPSPQFNQSLHGPIQSQSSHSMQQSSPRMPGQVSETLQCGRTNNRIVGVNEVMVILKYFVKVNPFIW
jgi:hypothetical protein